MDGAHLYLEYAVRVHLPTHQLPVGAAGKSPAIMSDIEKVKQQLRAFREYPEG